MKYLILIKMNLTHRSQSHTHLTFLPCITVFLRGVILLTAGSEPVYVLLTKDSGKDRDREERNNWIRQNNIFATNPSITRNGRLGNGL